MSSFDRQILRAFELAKSKLGIATAKAVASKILKARRRCGADGDCIKKEQMEGLSRYEELGVSLDISTENHEAEHPDIGRAEAFELGRPGIILGRCRMDYCNFMKLYIVEPVVSSGMGQGSESRLTRECSKNS